MMYSQNALRPLTIQQDSAAPKAAALISSRLILIFKGPSNIHKLKDYQYDKFKAYFLKVDHYSPKK